MGAIFLNIGCWVQHFRKSVVGCNISHSGLLGATFPIG